MPRDPFDRYYTPEWAAKAIVERLWRRGYLRDNEDRRRSLVWEPHCGVGRFVDALTTGHPALVPAQVVGTDLYPAREAPPHVSIRRKPHDALDGPPGLFQPTLVLGNPPYREAEEACPVVPGPAVPAGRGDASPARVPGVPQAAAVLVRASAVRAAHSVLSTVLHWWRDRHGGVRPVHLASRPRSTAHAVICGRTHASHWLDHGRAPSG